MATESNMLAIYDRKRISYRKLLIKICLKYSYIDTKNEHTIAIKTKNKSLKSSKKHVTEQTNKEVNKPYNINCFSLIYSNFDKEVDAKGTPINTLANPTIRK